MHDSETIDREIARQLYAKHGRTLVEEDNRLNAGDEKLLRLSEPLDRLLRDGHIEGPQFKAGDWLRKMYETAKAGGSCMNFDGSPPPTSSGSRTPPERLMEAWADLRWCSNALGMEDGPRLLDVVCLGVSVDERAKREGVNYRTMRKLIVLSLDKLADHLTAARKDF